MPVRAPRLCGCGKVVPSGARCICEVARAAERKARFDKTRPSASKRGYNRRWAKESRAFLERCPFCACCGQRLDLETPRAAVVDHITPHKGDETRFWDKSNWQRLCTPCHSGAKQRLERRPTDEELK